MILRGLRHALPVNARANVVTVVRCSVVACSGVVSGYRAWSRRVAVGVVLVLVAAGCSDSDDSASAPGTSADNATTSTTVAAPTGPLVRTGEDRLPPLWVQGVARIPGGWIFSGTNSLWRTGDDLAEITHTGPSIPKAWAAKGFNHVGDIDVVGRYIYAPLEQPEYEKGRQATARFDRDTLRFVDAVTVEQHENSFVTVDPETMTAYSMDRFDGDALTRYDVNDGWKPLAPLKLSRLLHRTQGADVYGDAVWISTDDAQHGVYRVDAKTGAVTRVARMGHPGGEGEGIDATETPSGFLHTLCVDAKLVPVWFGHFASE